MVDVKSCDMASDKLKDIWYESVVFLILSRVNNQKNSGWCGLTRRSQLVSIGNMVEDLCEKCFLRVRAFVMRYIR